MLSVNLKKLSLRISNSFTAYTLISALGLVCLMPAQTQAWGWGKKKTASEIKDESLKKNISKLKNRKWEVRYIAAEALGELKDPRAFEPLIAALEDESWLVRYSAARALGELRDPRAIKPLIARLNDNDSNDIDSEVQNKAVEALVKIGEDSILPLVAALNYENTTEEIIDPGNNRIQINAWTSRKSYFALKALGKFKEDPAVLGLILNRLDSLNPRFIRIYIGHVFDFPFGAEPNTRDILEEIKERNIRARAEDDISRQTRWIPLLSSLTYSSNWEIQEEAVLELALTPTEKAWEHLINALEREDLGDRVEIETLGFTDNPKAIPYLEPYLDESKEVEVRQMVANLIQRLEAKMKLQEQEPEEKQQTTIVAEAINILGQKKTDADCDYDFSFE